MDARAPLGGGLGARASAGGEPLRPPHPQGRTHRGAPVGGRRHETKGRATDTPPMGRGGEQGGQSDDTPHRYGRARRRAQRGGPGRALHVGRETARARRSDTREPQCAWFMRSTACHAAPAARGLQPRGPWPSAGTQRQQPTNHHTALPIPGTPSTLHTALPIPCTPSTLHIALPTPAPPSPST